MQNLSALDWTDILSHLENLATSEYAREHIRNLNCLASPEDAVRSFDEIDEVSRILVAGRRPGMESLDLFSTWFERLKREAVLKPLELKDVRSFCLEVIDLNDALNNIASDWLNEQQNELMDAKGPLSAIDQLMTASGDIRNDASETLYALFREKQDKERQLQGTLDSLVKAGQMEKVLQDRFVTNRQGRWVVPVKSGKQHDIKGVIHDQSQSKQTVFMEPQEVMVLNSQISRLEGEIEEEIETLLTQLSKFLHKLVDDFEASKTVLEHMDLRLAQAQLSQQLNANRVKFTDGDVRLLNVKHPLLILQGDNVIPNDVALTTKKRILLLSGPNAGGKTVLLKSVGIAAQMARCGMPVCSAEGSELPFFEHLLVAVGDDQSVYRNLSTFAAHLKTLTEASNFKGLKTLLLVDEICSSTDPEEGAALARSFIETFENNGLLAIITSHLGPLKEGWSKESGVINGRLEFDETKGIPTYRLYLGLPGQSLALKTAKAIGVPTAILERAVNYLAPETRDRHRRLDELEALKQEVENLRSQLRREQVEAQKTKETYFQLVTQFKKERETWMKKAVEKGEKRIEELLERARSQADSIKALNDIKAQLPTIIKTPEKQTIQSPEDFSRAFPPGSLVYIAALQQEGLVQSAPDPKGRVTVLSQSMRLQVPWNDLTFPKRAQQSRPAATQPGLSGGVSMGPGGTERVVDLRGSRVEDALRVVEQQLDVAIRNSEDRIKVIHGHGTDTLKKAVRTYLSRSPYVRKWKAGDANTGGDGITWVELVD